MPGIIESGKIAKEYGVTLAVQGHPPVVNCVQDLIDLVDEVDMEHVKIGLDLPLFDRQDEEYIPEYRSSNRQEDDSFTYIGCSDCDMAQVVWCMPARKLSPEMGLRTGCHSLKPVKRSDTKDISPMNNVRHS